MLDIKTWYAERIHLDSSLVRNIICNCWTMFGTGPGPCWCAPHDFWLNWFTVIYYFNVQSAYHSFALNCGVFVWPGPLLPDGGRE